MSDVYSQNILHKRKHYILFAGLLSGLPVSVRIKKDCFYRQKWPIFLCERETCFSVLYELNLLG